MDSRFFSVLYITWETQFTHGLSHCLSTVLFCEGFIFERFLKGVQWWCKKGWPQVRENPRGDPCWCPRDNGGAVPKEGRGGSEHSLPGQDSHRFPSAPLKRRISSSPTLMKKHFTFSSGLLLYCCAASNCAGKIEGSCCAKTIWELR